MSRAAYEIRAVGEVPPRVLEDFPGVTVSLDVAGTIIHADLTDEAELHGVLDALRRGGFTLVDVRRETDYDDDPAARAARRGAVSGARDVATGSVTNGRPRTTADARDGCQRHATAGRRPYGEPRQEGRPRGVVAARMPRRTRASRPGAMSRYGPLARGVPAFGHTSLHGRVTRGM